MRLLTVRHVTTYRYRERVGLGEHRMMFRPRESHDLRLVTTRLAITPAPSRLRWLHDVFDNSVAVASFAGTTTSELRFESDITLEHTTTGESDYSLEAQARNYPFTYAADELPDLVRALARQCPEDDLGDFVAGILAQTGFPAAPIETMALLRTITRTIRERFTYNRRDEKGVQRPCETLQRGRGSCRDFALLMMETVRSLGLAARFVSGYIVVSDAHPAIQTRGASVGGGATHAWLQVYLPGAGWVDFDPTNSGVGNRNLIRVAFAWDPEQAVPLWGTYFGARDAAIGMEVEVSVAEQTLAA